MDSSGRFELYTWGTLIYPPGVNAPMLANISSRRTGLCPHSNLRVRNLFSCIKINLAPHSFVRDLIALICDVCIVQSDIQLHLLLGVCKASVVALLLIFSLQFPLQVSLPACNMFMGFPGLCWGIFSPFPQFCLLIPGFNMGSAYWEPSVYSVGSALALDFTSCKCFPLHNVSWNFLPW